jgi:hypothetical protein
MPVATAVGGDVDAILDRGDRNREISHTICGMMTLHGPNANGTRGHCTADWSVTMVGEFISRGFRGRRREDDAVAARLPPGQ